jgi:SAM-dependent methyltransferase
MRILSYYPSMGSSEPERALGDLVAGFRAIGELSRLRLLAICCEGEWTVSELVQVMGQSQPRISRHLKVLAEAGLLERFREGGWVFYRAARDGHGGGLVRLLGGMLPAGDSLLGLDRHRLQAVRTARREQAERWFDGRAQDWESERDLAVDGTRIENAIAALFGKRPERRLLDIGTGTGRILQLLAPHVDEGLGIDLSRRMLAIARANLDRHAAQHCQVRQGDMYQLPLQDGSVTVAVLHQVLHFADHPYAVLAEARRVLAADGRLVVVDLLAHDQEWLRTEKHHRRLGFTLAEMSAWFVALGLRERPAQTLHGERLSVTIWVAELPSTGESHWDRIERRNAA